MEPTTQVKKKVFIPTVRGLRVAGGRDGRPRARGLWRGLNGTAAHAPRRRCRHRRLGEIRAYGGGTLRATVNHALDATAPVQSPSPPRRRPPRAAHGALQALAGTRDFVTLPALNVRVARRLQLPAVPFTSIYHRGRRARPSRPFAVYLAMEHAPESGPRGALQRSKTTPWFSTFGLVQQAYTLAAPNPEIAGR